MRRFLRRYWLAVAIVILAAALWGGLWANRYTSLALRSAFLLPEAFLDLPLPLPFLGEDIVTVTVYFAFDGRPVESEVYRPDDDDRHGALLIVPGAAPEALTDPRVVAIFRFAARMGLAVLVPHFPDLTTGILDPKEIEGVVAAFQFLEGLPHVDGQRMGILGFSAGSGLAVAGAADPRIRDQVRLLGTFGGYYDARDAMAAVTTKTMDLDGELRPWQPQAKAERIVRRNLIDLVEDSRERHLLRGAFSEASSVSASPDGLSPTGRFVYNVLANGDPRRGRELLAEAPPSVTDTLERISPSAYIDGLKAEVYIIHSRQDRLIPYVESRNLFDALQEREIVVHYAEVGIFSHLVPTVPTDPAIFLSDLAEFLHFAYRILLGLL
jgi:acetyl esterase/lipase